MAAEIPPEVDCLRLPQDGIHLDGIVRPQALPRVGGDFRVAGDTRVTLALAQDQNRKPTITGRLSVPLEARCQRCLDWMPLELEREFGLDVLTDIPAREPDDDYVYAPRGRLAVITLIEDEILLACPMIPAHNPAQCGAATAAAAAASTDRQKPFAGLDELVRAARNKST